MNELIQPETEEYPYSLFEVCGLELEYMIVDRDTLCVVPVADQLLQAAGGTPENEVYLEGKEGAAAWSNELVLHVVEFKTPEPVPCLEDLDALFVEQVRHANDLLRRWNARLMPAAMHPWMDPYREMRLWPHGNREIYQAFDRIFDCRGHGWANLQSVHINLPFADDTEFRRLHAAIRIVLPLLPALAASSPVMDGKLTGYLDNRLEVYRTNCQSFPEITGDVIPDTVCGRQDYEANVLSPIYKALEPLDPEGTLRYEWVNARGAIARFDRNAIEIRLLDIQECPLADVTIARLIFAVIKSLVDERFSTLRDQERLSTKRLHRVFMDTIKSGEAAMLDYPALSHCLGLDETPQPMGNVWRQLATTTLSPLSTVWRPLEILLREGCLARRIEKALLRSEGP
ncbi:MAG TPA: glutamate-cysteine ligase family protein, partial [Candidatus Hydrogenedentes bacterium]|nr:glutamate-cysteine ligase family protein [Candidatus Hydrogenedentota bacterium]